MYIDWTKYDNQKELSKSYYPNKDKYDEQAEGLDCLLIRVS